MNRLEINIPQRIIDALKNIQIEIPDAAIAGGFLRDIYFGKQYKDIDIFIPHVSNISDVLFGKMEEFKYEPTVVSTNFYATEMHGASYMPQTEVTRVWNLEQIYLTWEDKQRAYNLNINDQFQIIMLAEGLALKDRIHGYDFGVCQIYFDGNDCWATDAFMKDAENKTFTLTFCEDEEQFARSMRRWNRLTSRYSEFDLIIPEEYKKYSNIIT